MSRGETARNVKTPIVHFLEMYMKRLLATTAIALSAVLALPAVAQQTPTSPQSATPGTPPTPEGPKNPKSGSTGGSTITNDTTMTGPDASKNEMNKSKTTGARHKKPREQGAAATPSPTAPSGPKGDSPDPAPGTTK